MQDRRNPFYRPLWVRVLILGVCAGWTAFEWQQGGQTLWFWVALAIGIYALWSFFLAYDPDEGEGRNGPPPS